MSPADRAEHWRSYRLVMRVELALCLGVPLALHLVLQVMP